MQNPRIKAIFDKALEIRSPPNRKAFLDKVCAGTPEIRHKVEALLKAHEDAGSHFLEIPAVVPPAKSPNAGTCRTGSNLTSKALPETITHQRTTDNPPPADGPVGVGPIRHIGPYKLVKNIGEGGMGTVFLAEQEKPVRRKVALKLIKPGMDSAQVAARFEAERQALTMMDHLNIAKVLDVGAIKDGRPYFVMELVQGVPITEYCDGKKLTPRNRLDLFVQVCQAIQHAHRKGIVHRDIKPSNVLVTLYEGKPIPKVIDFGIAKAIGQQLTDKTLVTLVGYPIGTPSYMSPEQAAGSPDIDTRSDIYALGVLLYELLTGTTPIDKERLRKASYDEIRRIICEEEPPRPSTRISTLGKAATTLANQRQTDTTRLREFLRGELDWIVMKCLEKDPNRRYESATDLTSDIQRYLQDEPVHAHPPSSVYLVRKFARKHRLILAAACGLAVALLLIIVILVISNNNVSSALTAKSKALQEKTTALAAESKALKEKDAVFAEARKMLLESDSLLGHLLPGQKSPGAVDKAVVAKALKTYENLASALGDAPEARELAAVGQFRIASLRAFLGESDKAEEGFREAARLYERLAAEFPHVAAYRHEQCRSLIGLGNALRTLGKWHLAKMAYRVSADMATKLVADFPTNQAYRHDQAESQNGLALLALDSDDKDQAREAMELAVAIWKTLADNSPSAVYRYNLALAYNNLILVLDGQNFQDKREDIHHKVDLLLGNLEKEFPNSPEVRFVRSLIYNSHGHILLDKNQVPEAEKVYHQAIVVAKKLTVEYPEVPEYRMVLAAIHSHLALCLKKHNPRDAEQACRLSIDLRKRLAKDHHNVPSYQHDLASSYMNLGDLQSKYDPDEAKKTFELAIDLEMKLRRAFPEVASYQIKLAGLFSNVGNVTRDQNKPKDALAWYEKSMDLLDPIVAQKRAGSTARLYLRNASWDRANAFSQLRRHANAANDWKRAIDLDDEGADRNDLRLFLEVALLELNLEKRSPVPTGAGIYKAAREFARAADRAIEQQETSLHKHYARRALELLKDARSAGYFQDPSRIQELGKDPGFQALRGDADFQKLVGELAGRKTP